MIFKFSENYKLSILILLISMYIFYSFYLYSFLPSESLLKRNESYKGKMLWQKFNCSSCHQIYGLGGYLGPDLTNVYSIKGAVHIKAFLNTGNKVMPNFNLSSSEINMLLFFFQEIDKTGKSDPKTFYKQPNGTISQD